MTFIFLNPFDGDFPPKGAPQPYLFGNVTREQKLDSIAKAWEYFRHAQKPSTKFFFVDAVSETLHKTPLETACSKYMSQVRAPKRKWLAESRRQAQCAPQ